MPRSLYIVVVGCGRLGGILASHLSRDGHSVVIIDRDEAAFAALAPEFSGFEVEGDASELAVLNQAKCDRADCLLAVTGQDNLNLMLTQIARQIFNIQTVLARVQDPARQHIFNDLNITTVSPTELSAEVFLQALQQHSKD